MNRKSSLITLLVFFPFMFAGCDNAGMQADADKSARDQAALQELTKVRPTPPLAKPTGWEFKPK